MRTEKSNRSIIKERTEREGTESNSGIIAAVTYRSGEEREREDIWREKRKRSIIKERTER
jgi:hypothetical protein